MRRPTYQSFTFFHYDQPYPYVHPSSFQPSYPPYPMCYPPYASLPPYGQPYPYAHPYAQLSYDPYSQNPHLVGVSTNPAEMSPPHVATQNSRSTSVSETGGPRITAPVVIEDDDHAGEGEGTAARRRKRLNWSQQDDMRLISAWLNKSLDPVDRNNKKFNMYWSKVTEEYNASSLLDRRRDVRHCKDHWQKSNKKIIYFNDIYCRLRDAYVSGHSDGQLMSQARDMYRQEVGHPFILEHWWSAVRGQSKWSRSYFESPKRARLNEESAYMSSSNNDNDPVEVPRPEGRDAVKQKRKGKDKISEDSLAREETLQRISEANAKLNRWTQNDCTISKNLQEFYKRKEKASLVKSLTKLLVADTSNFSDVRQAAYTQAIETISKIIKDIENK